MLMGVMCFSLATGTIASLITTYDSQEALMKEKIATLNDIHIEYGIQTELFNRLARNIKFDHSKKKKDIALIAWIGSVIKPLTFDSK